MANEIFPVYAQVSCYYFLKTTVMGRLFLNGFRYAARSGAAAVRCLDEIQKAER